MENDFSIGEHIELLTTIIFNFAQGQFEAHGIPASLGRVVIENVKSRQMDLAFNEVVNSKLPAPEPAKREDHTGSIEDLKKDLQDFYGKKEGE